MKSIFGYQKGRFIVTTKEDNLNILVVKFIVELDNDTLSKWAIFKDKGAKNAALYYLNKFLRNGK